MEPRTFRMYVAIGKAGTGVSAMNEGFPFPDSRPVLPKKNGVVYDLLALRWETLFGVPGAGTGFRFEWALTKSSVVTMSATEVTYISPKHQDLIFQDMLQDTDSYVQVGRLSRGNVKQAEWHWDKDARPSLLTTPRLHSVLNFMYDSTPTRTVTVYHYVDIWYLQRAANKKEYDDLELKYGLRG